MAKWTKTTEDHYHEMLGMMPPELHLTKGFLVGEPSIHRRCAVWGTVVAAFPAFIRKEDEYYECDTPMTMGEFRAVTHAEVQ